MESFLVIIQIHVGRTARMVVHLDVIVVVIMQPLVKTVGRLVATMVLLGGGCGCHWVGGNHAPLGAVICLYYSI